MKVSTRALIAESWRRTCIVGHRGSASTHPENTLPAFEEGIASGADAVECDVHLSQDGELVVIHDATLDRTTPLRGAIRETHSSALREAGVPFLPDVTAHTKDRTVLVVELKEGDDVSPLVAEHLESRDMTDQAILFSFDKGHIEAVKRRNPRFFTVYLIGYLMDPSKLEPVFAELVDMGVDAVGTDYRNCPEEFVREAQDRGLPLFVWTVPPGEEVARLRALEVNFIITDHPRAVIASSA